MIAGYIKRNKISPIGIDVGKACVRAVQLSQVKDVSLILEVATCPVAHHEVGDAEWGPWHCKELRRCMAMAQFRGRRAVTGLVPPDIQSYTLDLPAAVVSGGSTDADNAARIEIERMSGMVGTPLESRYWALPPTSVPGPTALGVAADAGAIDTLLANYKSQGLRCVSIDTLPTALGRVGSLLNRWDPLDVWGMLDVGERQTRLMIYVGDDPVLLRNAGSGSGVWTDHLAAMLGVSREAATVYKHDHGLAARGRRDRDDAKSSVNDQMSLIVLNALRNDLTEIASEVKRSYEYVLSCYPRHSAADLVLVGSGAALKNLPAFLTDTLGITVRRASSYLETGRSRIVYSSKFGVPFEALAFATGLAIPE